MYVCVYVFNNTLCILYVYVTRVRSVYIYIVLYNMYFNNNIIQETRSVYYYSFFLFSGALAHVLIYTHTQRYTDPSVLLIPQLGRCARATLHTHAHT